MTIAVIRMDCAALAGWIICFEVCVCVFVEFLGKDISLFGMVSASVYLISGVESQAGCRSKNTTKIMLKRQDTVKADNYDNTALF